MTKKTTLFFFITFFAIASCKFSPDKNDVFKVYEEPNGLKISKKIKESLKEMGYDTSKYKLKKTELVKKTDGKKTVNKIYESSGFQKNIGGKYDCMKIFYSKVTTTDKISLVQAIPTNVTCFRSIGSTSFKVERESDIYNQFYNKLSEKLGKEPLKNTN